MNRGTVRFRSDVQNLFHSPGDGAISGERGCMQGCPPPPPLPCGRVCAVGSAHLPSFVYHIEWLFVPSMHGDFFLVAGGLWVGAASTAALGSPVSPLYLMFPRGSPLCPFGENTAKRHPEDIQMTARRQREGRLGVWFSLRSGTQAAIDFVVPASHHSSTAFCLGSEWWVPRPPPASVLHGRSPAFRARVAATLLRW